MIYLWRSMQSLISAVGQSRLDYMLSRAMTWQLGVASGREILSSKIRLVCEIEAFANFLSNTLSSYFRFSFIPSIQVFAVGLKVGNASPQNLVALNPTPGALE